VPDVALMGASQPFQEAKHQASSIKPGFILPASSPSSNQQAGSSWTSPLVSFHFISQPRFQQPAVVSSPSQQVTMQVTNSNPVKRV